MLKPTPRVCGTWVIRDHGSLTANRARPRATSRVEPFSWAPAPFASAPATRRICASVPTMGRVGRRDLAASPEGLSVSSHPAMHTTPKKPVSGGGAAFASATISARSGSVLPSTKRGSVSPGNKTWSYIASTGTRTARLRSVPVPVPVPATSPFARRSRSACAAAPPRTSPTSPRYE